MTVYNRIDGPLIAGNIGTEVTIFLETGSSVKLITTEMLKRKAPGIKLIEPYPYEFQGS